MTGEPPSQEPSLISWMERSHFAIEEGKPYAWNHFWPQLSPFAPVYSLSPKAHPILQNKQVLGALKEGLLEPEQ